MSTLELHASAVPGRYLLRGDATRGPLDLLPAPGVDLPRPANFRRPFRLKLLHLNDLHGNVARFSRFGSRPIFSRINARVVEARRARARKRSAALLFLSSGDDMAGSVFDELLHAPTPLHVGYHLYSAAGLDAGVIGNHDLDRGAAGLARAIAADATFPLLAANLRSDLPLADPAAIFVLKGVRVGLIGLTTPAQIKRNDANIQIADPVRTTLNLLPVLRPWCDVILILSHLGHSLSSRSAEVHLAGDVELAQRLPAGAVDLIIGGHTHQALNPGGLEADNVVNGIPIVQAGSQGQYLGEVTLTLSRVAGNGSALQTAVAVTDARLTQTADLPEDELFEQTYVQPLLHAVAPVFSQSLGRVVSHPDLDTEAIHNDFNSGESALANFIADGIVARCRAHGLVVDLALLDRSVVQRGLPNDGRLTFRDWFNLMPTVDTIRLCRVSGRQLLALLQDNAYRLARPDEAHTDCGFLHFSGAVRYAVLQNGRRAHTQILHSMVDGRPLAQRLDEMFTIACHSFIRSSARRWERARAGRSLPLVDMQVWRYEDTGLFLRDELLAHIRQQGGLNGSGGLRRDGRLQVYHFARRPTALTPAPA